MEKLNLEEMVSNVLWVDRENRCYITRKESGYYAYPEKALFAHRDTFDEAKSYLKKHLTTALEAQDQVWIELISRNYHPHEGGLRGTYLRGAQEGIHHERDRVRLALDELLFRGPHCAKSDLLLAVRRHLGLEEPN